MAELVVRDFGQIAEAEVVFGDLTLIIGPQASGKSIFLQLFKLLQDSVEIARNLKKQGYDWRNDPLSLLDLYFGENLRMLWKDTTLVQWGKKTFSLKNLMAKEGKTPEKVFYVPAQRVMTLDNGWPRPFTGFRIGDPYVVKNFSERLRLLMEAGLGGAEGPIFPQVRRLKKPLRDYLDRAIFHGAKLELDKSQLQRRIVLRVGNTSLPYMTWSAGQREFMPLLLGLYWLIPQAAAAKKTEVDWVVIEEPEMGLHPRAILAVILLFLELITRGYRLIVSTHSPIIPQMIWALQTIRELKGGVEELFQLFDIEKHQVINRIFQDTLIKNYRTYYFDVQPGGVRSRDISSLDPGDDAAWVADWGGLTEFSSKASEIIANLAGECE